MWNNWSGKRRFWLIRILYVVSPAVGILVALPLLFIPFPALWMRFVLAFPIGFVVLIAVVIFTYWMSPNCPHCGAKLSVMTRYYPYSACPHCGEKFDEPM